MTAQRFLKRCCWSGCGKVKPWERGVFLCTLADVCSSFGHKVRTLHLCPWLLPSKWPLLSPARDSPSETCTNPKGEATDSCWQKTVTEDILPIFVAEHVWTKVLLCMAIFPYISQVLQGVASVTSCHFNVFYIFLHLKPRFPHRVETALAFSGGGGRALAFSLDVLRALEHLGLMRLEWFCSATSGSHCDMMCGSHVWTRVGICWITLIISRSMCVGVPAVCLLCACHFVWRARTFLLFLLSCDMLIDTVGLVVCFPLASLMQMPPLAPSCCLQT